jgi:methionine-rich copper-binding protein CopC
VTTATPAAEAVLAASPSTLTLAFDSQLADSGNQIALYHSDRSAVGTYTPPPQNGKVPTMQTKLPELAPDVYTVAWTSVSGEDGHTLQQFYAFTVGASPTASDAPALPPLKAGDTQVTLTASRGNVGPMVLHAAVLDASGKPLSNLQRVILRYQPTGLAIGEDEIVAPASGSNAQTPAFTLGLSGSWDFDVIVRRVGLDDVDARMQLTLQSAPPAQAAATPTSAPSPIAATAAAATPTTAGGSAAVAVTTTPGGGSPTVAPATSVPTIAPTAPPTAVPTPALAAAPSPTTAATPLAKLPESSSSSILIGAIVAVVVVGGGIVAYVVRRR